VASAYGEVEEADEPRFKKLLALAAEERLVSGGLDPVSYDPRRPHLKALQSA